MHLTRIVVQHKCLSERLLFFSFPPVAFEQVFLYMIELQYNIFLPQTNQSRFLVQVYIFTYVAILIKWSSLNNSIPLFQQEFPL